MLRFLVTSRLLFGLSIVLAIFVARSSAFAVELTDEVLRSARRVVLVPGTFDPINKGHLSMIERVRGTWNADLVILLPNASPIHKIANPVSVRIRLISAIVKADPHVGVPSSSKIGSVLKDSRFVARLRELNPEARIAVAVGEDVASKSLNRLILEVQTRPDEVLVVERPGAKANLALAWKGAKTTIVAAPDVVTSSTKVREILRANFDLYFATPEERATSVAYSKLLELMPKALVEEILRTGLYLDRGVGGAASLERRFQLVAMRSVHQLSERFGIYEDIKSELVKRVAETGTKEIEIGGKFHRTLKHLGSGLSADAYLVEYEGRIVVAKIAREDEKSRNSILRSIPLHLWAQKKLGMNVPNLVAYDPEGRWILTELVEGLTISKLIERDGRLSSTVRASLYELHGKVERMQTQSAVRMDLAPDNIIERNGIAYLVDLGPIPTIDMPLPSPREMVEHWVKKFTRKTQTETVSLTRPRAATSCKALF
ncbi:MAG: adenylyltransferase/cytidyltransferase family protein [Bdellovibrionota bacterium]